MNLRPVVQERLSSWIPSHVRLLCAISGGPDSVALGHILKGLPYRLIFGHVDHQLRRDSGIDKAFVQRLARRWGIPFKSARVPVAAFARVRRLGLEEAARELRYSALVKMARQAHCPVIVTAHHADDQAETVLLNFLRGAGSSGLAGIPPRRAVSPRLCILRPFLSIHRRHILAYLKENELPYRTDPSNQALRFTRNRLRHRTLPLLERFYPGLSERLVQVSEILRDEENLWDRQTRAGFAKTVRKNGKIYAVDLRRFLGYHKALGRRILRRLLNGASFRDLERVYKLVEFPRTNSSLQMPGGRIVRCKGRFLVIQG